MNFHSVVCSSGVVPSIINIYNNNNNNNVNINK